MDAVTQQKIDQWLSGNYDQAVKDEIIALQKTDAAGLEDAFYKNLEFGTGGLRGIMGIGITLCCHTHCIFIHAVGANTHNATQAAGTKLQVFIK